MNRTWITLMRTDHQYTGKIGEADEDVIKLWEAESNSPNEEIRLSGDPEVLEATKILLLGLPATYTKKDAYALMEQAIEETFN